MSCHVDIRALRAASVAQVGTLPLYGTSISSKRRDLTSFTRTLRLVLEVFQEANEMRRQAHLVHRIDNE